MTMITEQREERVLIRFGADGNNNPKGPAYAVLRERFGEEVEVVFLTAPCRIGRSVHNPALWVYEVGIEVTYDPDEVILDPPAVVPARGEA